jgi:hypothetical protein
MFKVPEKYRIKNHPILNSDNSFGNNGAFKIPLSNRSIAFVIASEGMGWEHVSIHISTDHKDRTPTWSEMCKIKDIFWSDDDCVVQYHPPKSDYVNNHQHTLHLWRPIEDILPRPDPIMVGYI